MKLQLVTNKIGVLFGVVLLSFNVFCQSPQTFPLSENNPVWKETTWYYQNSDFLLFCLHGDTLINDNLYQKLYISGDTVYNDSDKSYRGAIREEEGKIYIIYRYKESQSLLFDFTANEGDTIWMKSIYLCRDLERYIEYVLVESIDSIEINGIIHKVVNVTDGFHHDRWIEGIGNDGEIFCPLTLLTDDGFNGSEITCFKKDGWIYYPDSSSDCLKNNTGIGENTLKENPFSIYPNPTGSLVEIKSNSSYRIEKVNIVNMYGSVVKTFNASKAPEVMLILNGLTSGNYIVEIVTVSNESFYLKIIKE